MTNIQPGALVRYREREWVVLPNADRDLLLLRPIGGSVRELCGVLRPLAEQMRSRLPYETLEAASFPLPDAAAVQDQAAVRLLFAAARLLLRDGAAPFRSLGHLSVRPRPYQFVPLLMALRQETVRLLIADDVGVGKTIEAGLTARELLDRGLVQRVAVICPPYLCEQWQKELAEKFHINAVVIRSSTVARLERDKPPDKSIFAHYPHLVASIDTVKSDRYRAAFLQHCPELVIVDEAHGAAQPTGTRNTTQQQRHELLLKLVDASNAAGRQRHLILLTATPHSGVESAFRSLLGLLKSEFRDLDLTRLASEERIDLARHFVQRRRIDVKQWMGEDTPFPTRDLTGAEQPYHFSPAYRKFYEEVYRFAGELVQSAATLSGWQRRMRFWSALALLRCVTSSPAAAELALRNRLQTGEERNNGTGWRAETGQAGEAPTDDALDASFMPLIYDATDNENSVDAPPGAIFDAQEQDPAWPVSDRRKLRDFARMAQKLRGADDAKLQTAIAVTRDLLQAGYHPILWCRYIATADYVAQELQSALGKSFKELRVTAITGAQADDERRLLVESLQQAKARVLVATDCLSEGINLQEHFSAVVHYDLPWNPNRLEQREGRIDRFGQPAPQIKAVLIFGQNNPVDGAVLDVLLRKAREIQRTLGVTTPLPANSETVMEAVLTSLFARAGHSTHQQQLSLFTSAEAGDTGRMVEQIHNAWTQAADRERENRTRFAQRAIKPEEVARELQETEAVLGTPAAVRAFLQTAGQRLNFGLHTQPRRAGEQATTWLLQVTALPKSVQVQLGDLPNPWPITFDSPTPPGLSYIGRNHVLIEALSEYLVDCAFHPQAGDQPEPAARSGVIRTKQVQRRTTLFLLRLRFLQTERADGRATMTEETLVWGFTGFYPTIQSLELEAAQTLLEAAQASANVDLDEKVAVLTETLDWWPRLRPQLATVAQLRAGQVAESHRRVRRLLQGRTPFRVEAQTPPDLLGVLVLLPEV